MSNDYVFKARFPRLPQIHPIIILVGAGLAIDYAKQCFKKKKAGACPACGRGNKEGFTVKDKGCGHTDDPAT
jgi:hypothetical protein